MKKKLQLKAKALRKKGYSIKEIKQLVDASKSSISLWVKGEKLSDKSQKRLMSRYTHGQIASQEVIMKKTEMKNQIAQDFTDNIISKIKTDKNIMIILCSMIYWCEGDKDLHYSVCFTNSDPCLIKTFLFLFRKSFDLDESKFRILMHLHSYHDEKKQKAFWSKITNITIAQFNKSYLKPSNHKYKKDGYQGCIRVNYYDNSIGRKLAHLAKSFMESYK